MLALKSCPKCKGAISQESDIYGKYQICINCGLTKEGEYNGIKKEEKDGTKHS